VKRNLNLNWIRTFEAAARLSGFSVAGKELGLTQVAVVKQVKALETQLGRDLFIRLPKKIELTAMGKAYLLLVQETLQTLAVSTYSLFGSDQNSTIVVRTSAAMIVCLAPKLREFQLRHPATSFILVTAVWADIVDTQNIDIDIVLAPNAGSCKPPSFGYVGSQEAMNIIAASCSSIS
jgi:LysR family transcriptional regulator, glycine cleavage system transcriptional activator